MTKNPTNFREMQDILNSAYDGEIWVHVLGFLILYVDKMKKHCTDEKWSLVRIYTL